MDMSAIRPRKFIPAFVVIMFVLSAARISYAQSAATTLTTQSTTQSTTATAGGDDGKFDPAQYMLGSLWGVRSNLVDNKGIVFDSNLILDDTKNFTGGLDTASNSIRERFDFGLKIDTEKLFGLHGGTFYVVYQLQHGGNSSQELTGDAQNINFGTNADGRSQIGQLWYEQKFLDDTLRVRIGKQDGNTDFDVLDNGQDFLNNSFSTSPTLYLMPSFPDNGMGAQIFYEPKSGYYIGAGVFDGSIAQGDRIGEYGPAHFLDSASNLFLIAETGKRYDLDIHGNKLPAKLSFGGWWSTDTFVRLDSPSTQDGTGGVYMTYDQIRWKPPHAPAISLGTVSEIPADAPTETYTGAIALTSSASWADPTVNRIDGNLLAGLTWTGMIRPRPIDIFGIGATLAHFSDDAATREPYELTIETFYRIRFTQWISLKPDLQYIIHPNGSGNVGSDEINSALAFTLRLEMTF